MTHNIHPFSQRLGIVRDWKSRWFGGKGNRYRDYLETDLTIRRYLDKALKTMFVSSVDIERNDKLLRVIVKSSRPGLIIGRNGEHMKILQAGLQKALRKADLEVEQDIKIDVEEIRSPDSDASIVAQMVVEALEKRMPFRRVMKQTAEKVMANRNVEGVRIRLSGRLGGAEMARIEQIRKGRVPLQTLRADVDYAEKRAMVPQGVLGVKVWIYRGDIFNK